MFTVYIYNYKSGNSIVAGPNVMFTVPLSGPSPVINPVVKCSEDMADAFDFSMESYSPYYEAMIPLKTRIRVDYDGDTIFYGRVLTVQTSTIYNTKQVNCEGAFSYFNDTFYEGKQEKKIKEISFDTFFLKVLKNHNDNYNSNNNPELWKVIRSGTIGISLKSEKRKWEPTSWTDTASCLKSLTDYYGGHFRIRHNISNDNLYLDWYKYYARDLGDELRPKIEITKNLLDISSDNVNVDNIFTRLIPIGSTDAKGNTIYVNGYKYKDKNNTDHIYSSNKYIPVTLLQGSSGLYTDGQLNDEYHSATEYRDAETNFGIIYKTASFPNADTQKKLWDYAKDYIKTNYYGMVTSFSIKAVDMHILNQNSNYPKILLGDCVDITFRGNATNVTKTKLICSSAQYDLFAPENNSYTIGVPSDLMTREYGKKKSKPQKKDEPASTNVGKPQPQDNQSDPVISWDSIYKMIYSAQNNDPDDTENYWDNYDSAYLGTAAGTSFRKNGKLTGSVKCFDPTYTGDPAQRYDNLITGKLFGKLTHSGKTKYVAYCADYGLFACTRNSGNPCTVQFTYTHQKGANTTDDDPGTITQTTTDPTTGDSTSETTATDDGTPDGNVTYSMKPQELSYPPYDPTKTYSVGAMVTYNGYIYKCKTAISTPEAWNASHWTKYGSASAGKVNIGYDVTAGSGDNWRIKLNTPIQYTDADGNTQVADGFVSASDFHVQEIPSFKTKIGIFDIVIAGKIQAQEIAADLAELRKLLSDQIVANTSIRSSKGYFTNAWISNVYSSQNLYYTNGSGNNIPIQKCYNQCTITESQGTITLTMYPADGSTPRQGYDIASFNMAATQFYINAVAAARAAGWAGCYADIGLNYSSGNTYYIGPSGTSETSEMTIRPAAKPTETGQHASVPNVWIKVKCRALRLRTAVVTPTSAGTIVKKGSDSGGTPYDGLEEVVVNGDSNLVSGNIKKGKSIFNVSGSCIELNAQAVVKTPGKNAIVVLPDSGYNALSSVTINGDNDLIPENIKKGKSIFGVDGAYQGSSISSSDIQIHNYGSSNSGTKSPGLKTAILQAIDRGGKHSYLSFEVYVDGTDAKKTYWMDFGSEG